MTLAYSWFTQGLDLSGDIVKAHQSKDGTHLSMSAHSRCVLGLALSTIIQKPPALFPPNSTIHHHWSIPSINGQVCLQSISISASSPPLCIPLPLIFTSPSCVPHLSPPSHAPTSHPKVSGVTPCKVIPKQPLERNQYYINKPQRAFALILYDLCGKGLRASISSSGLLPKLSCSDNQKKTERDEGRRR